MACDTLHGSFSTNVLESAPVPIAVHDTDHTLVWANRAYREAAGLSRREIVGRTCMSVWRLDRHCQGCPVRLTLRSGKEHEAELTPWNQDHWPLDHGSWLSRASPLRDEGGALVGGIEALYDISRRKNAEETLKQFNAHLEERIRQRTENLAESEAQLRAAFHRSPVGKALLSPAGRIIRVNDKLCRLLGRSEEELLDSMLPDFAHPDDAESDAPLVQRLLADELATYEVEKRYRHRRGGHIRTLLSVSLVRGSGGRPLYLIAQIQDVTEQKRTEERLRQKNEEQALLLESIPTQLWFLTDPYTYGAVNQAHADFLGLPKHFLEYRPLREFLSREEARVCEAGNLRVFAEQTPIHTEEWLCDAQGNPRLIAISKTPKVDGRGNVEYVVCSGTDVTKRKQIEEALKENEARFRSIVEGAPDAMFVQTGRRFAYMNDATVNLFGACSSEELIGRPVLEFIEPSYRAAGRERMRLLMEEKREVPLLEEVFLRLDGGKVPVEVAAVPTVYNGRDGAVVFVRDITLRKQTEHAIREAKKRAEAASRAKSEFLAKMSHDIRTPMNSVLGMLRLVLAGDVPDRQRERIQVAKDSAESLLWLLNDLLDLSRIEADKFALHEKEFRPRRILDDVSKEMELSASEKGLDLAVTVDPGLPERVQGDPHRLKQLLINLVSNAIKFTDSGWIRLEARLQQELAESRGDGGWTAELLFAVRDTGRGIDEDSLERIFDSYEQCAGPLSAVPGAGLGLAICKKLVWQMGGSVTAESEPGKGSVFSLRIPFRIAGDPPNEAPTASEDGLAEDGLPPLRILLVEDERMNRIFTVDLLATYGHVVEVAEDGERALEMLARKGFDLVLMDIKMPVMDGIEATMRIRTADPVVMNPEIPIIGLSAHAAPQEEIDRFKNAGFDSYVIKPVSFDALFSAMAEVLGRKNRN